MTLPGGVRRGRGQRAPAAGIVRRVLAAVGLAVFALAGCTQPKVTVQAPPPGEALVNASWKDLPGWQDDRLAEVLPALRLQCRRLALLPADTALGGRGIARIYGGRAGQWHDACEALSALAEAGDPRAFLQGWFQPYRIDTAALVTGYFEPTVPGALQRGGIYQTPVLARPADLVPGGAPDAQGRPGLARKTADGRVVPYFTRQEIEAGAMQGQARPVAWLASPVDLLFAQIQGSARVQLEGGGLLRLAFDGRNGRPYTPVGRVLVEQNAIAEDQVSMQSIRRWLEANPAKAKAVMDRNESYVFFKAAADTDPSLGPVGAMGVALTAGRSAAVDRAFVPLASPLFVSSTIPDGRAWQHLVLAQDLGSAIAGQARVDVFLGVGPVAADWAGRMHQPGTVWVLLPRGRGKAAQAALSNGATSRTRADAA